jgi:hypothetical protein
MIFGGIVPAGEDDEKNNALDNGQLVTVTKQSLHLDVTNGSIKRGPDMVNASYFTGSGSQFAQSNVLYAFGFGLNKVASSAGDKSKEAPADLNPNLSKKVLHCYKVEENEWSEMHEGIFSGPSKRSLESLDD